MTDISSTPSPSISSTSSSSSSVSPSYPLKSFSLSSSVRSVSTFKPNEFGRMGSSSVRGLIHGDIVETP
ncbi:hypothetical protein Hanom_Chr07g00665741 [Helianthus anomalus]